MDEVTKVKDVKNVKTKTNTRKGATSQ